MNLKDEDELINVLLTEEDTILSLVPSLVYAVRFNQLLFVAIEPYRTLTEPLTKVNG